MKRFSEPLSTQRVIALCAIYVKRIPHIVVIKATSGTGQDRKATYALPEGWCLSDESPEVAFERILKEQAFVEIDSLEDVVSISSLFQDSGTLEEHMVHVAHTAIGRTPPDVFWEKSRSALPLDHSRPLCVPVRKIQTRECEIPRRQRLILSRVAPLIAALLFH